MFLLDTNVISELRRRDKANRLVLDWAAAVPAAQFYISVITVLEIEQGILQVSRRDQAQGARLRAWFDTTILPTFGDRILVIDIAVAQRCAALHVPDPRAERDALIAATALVHGMTVVTRNVADFVATKVPLINPWTVQQD